MKQKSLAFNKRLSIIFIALALFSLVIHQFVFALNISLVIISLLFFFAMSSSLHHFLLICIENFPKKFAQRLMISMMIKLFSSIIFYGIIAYLNRTDIKAITAWFLTFYLIFHFNLTFTVNRMNKKSVE